MRKLLLVLFCAFSYLINAQKLEDFCQKFQIVNKKDTITFIVFGSKEDLKIKKPLFLFRQGSQPRPLLEIDNGVYYPQLPLDIKPYQADYHIVMIQKAGTAFLADSIYMKQYNEKLNMENSPIVTMKYLENNSLQKATSDCNNVINFLIKKPWIDAKKVIFCGGSEGFTVGANLAANFNKNITHLILSSGHAGRRFEHLIFQTRLSIKAGEISAKEGQAQVEHLYDLWKDMHKYPKAINKNYGDTYLAWHSFSIKNMDNLLKINVPLYIAYGTDDNEIAIGLDFLPLEFIANGKKNLTLKAYPNHDHQFFGIVKDVNGKVIDKIYNGDKVAKEWFDWLKK
jgi:hypothetical protein